MPYADPSRSFESAVRHLFRHWADARALRRNPIVRKAVADADTRGDAELVADVRMRALRSAGTLRERHAAIVAAIFAADRPEATAKRLGLSLRQYYRERADACRTLALALTAPTGDVPVAAWLRNGTELLFSRAASLVDQGWSKKAVALLDGAWPQLASAQERFEAGLELADALVSLGEMARSKRLLEHARRDAVATAAAPNTANGDRLVLSEARHAFAAGFDLHAGTALETLAARHATENRCDGLACDIATECGLWYSANARFGEARAMLQRAQTIAASLGGISPRGSIALDLLRAYCAEDVIDEFDGSRVRFERALGASTKTASMRGTLESTVGLMGYCASIGCDDAAFALAVRALEMARSMDGREHLAFAAAWIATTLCKTRHWQAIEPLLTDPLLARCGTLHWVFLKETQGAFLARLGRYDEAEASFDSAYAGAKRLGNPKWQAIALRDSGVMQSRLGRREGAQSLEQALHFVEDGSVGAWSRFLVYDAAAKALHDQSIARRARDLKRALSSSPPPVIVRVEPQPRATTKALRRYLTRPSTG